MAAGGLNIYGELWRAQLEQISDPSPGIKSRIYWSTTSSRPKIDTGSLLSPFLLNDQNMVMGTNGTAASNTRWNRSAAATLELLIGSDTTAEGTSTPANWAKLNTKLGGSKIDTYLDFTEVATPGANPAASTRRAYFKSDGKLYSLDSAGVETAVGTTTALLSIAAKTANYTLTSANDYVEGDATSGSFALTLPSAAANTGKVFYLKKSDSSANLVTVTATIDGATNVILRQQNEFLVVTSNGTEYKTLAKRKAPTIQKFTSGSGTYTLPADCKWIEVLLVGGGGGGAGSSTAANAGIGTDGGNSTFGSTLLVGNGGGAGVPAGGSGLGGAGGSASLGSGVVGLSLTGGSGVGVHALSTIALSGGLGGTNPLGGGGNSCSNSAGGAGVPFTGAGGGAAGTPLNGYTGASGGAGGYARGFIYNPSATYAYAVGGGGNAGTAGTGGQVGGGGGGGLIIVTEFY